LYVAQPLFYISRKNFIHQLNRFQWLFYEGQFSYVTPFTSNSDLLRFYIQTDTKRSFQRRSFQPIST